MDITFLIPAHLRSMRPYAATPLPPGGVGGGLIKLDANENLLPPSPRVLEAIAATPPNLYPDPDQNELREAIGEFVGAPKELILAGAGGDEILDLVTRLFLSAGDVALDTPPTFGVFKALADALNARYVPVHRHTDFSLDVDAIERAAQANPGAKLLYVCNPNNPDGSLTSEETLLRLLKLPLVVLLDEAYIEFSGRKSMASRVMAHPNLIVLRTFSKLAGLAGLRVGYGVFSPQIAPHVWKLKQYFTPNAAAQNAAIAALRDQPHMQAAAQAITAERDRMGEALSELGWIHPLPSYTNFLLCKVDGNAKEVHAYLAQRGILTRYFDRDDLREYVRISVGRPEHTDELVRVLKEM